MIARAVERWVAIRAAHESAGLDFEQLALITGWSVRSIQRRAAREKWVPWRVAGRQPDIKTPLRKVAESLIAQVQTLAIGEDGEPLALDKARIDTISVLTRTLEKIIEIMPSGGEAKEDQTKRDADMAEALKRIDQRIVELAKGYARQLGKTKSEG
ncbi:hypothetical protein EET67_13365 [Pseudaminobacter arsenicus]|uniref:Uncharacterized protein n=1 Tax=Borborobacter arsenicus TaxID=1851146 RepID=A0A432V5B9_9HYPH|nr:hypothetical protein [Pseudaminobacter arsenicus]RUM97347.1 hypothetical protein EET67_13365 [Pseudaminobacter arsenicus]